MYYLICPNVIFTVEPENIRKRFDFREVTEKQQWEETGLNLEKLQCQQMLSLVTQKTHFIYCAVCIHSDNSQSTDNPVHLAFPPATFTNCASPLFIFNWFFLF